MDAWKEMRKERMKKKRKGKKKEIWMDGNNERK